MTSPETRNPASTTTTLSRTLERLQLVESQHLPDVVVALRDLTWTGSDLLYVPSLGDARPNEWARLQLAQILGVRFCRWFEAASPAEKAEEMTRRLRRATGNVRLRFIRCSNRIVLRAVVRPSYSPIADSWTVRMLATALRGVDAHVYQLDLTDRVTSMMVCVGEAQSTNKTVGETCGAITMVNSGVGWSQLTIGLSLLRLVCKNGMRAPVWNAHILRVRHRCLDHDSMRRQLADGLRAMPENFVQANIALSASTGWKVTNVEAEARELLRESGLIQRHHSGVIAAYKIEPHSSVFGVSQAITRYAQQATPEDRLALEELAGSYVLRSAQ